MAALCVFLYFMLSANRESRAAFSDVQEAVISAADLTPMAEGDNQTFKRLYGLSASDYENVLLYYPTTNMGAEELLLIQLEGSFSTAGGQGRHRKPAGHPEKEL